MTRLSMTVLVALMLGCSSGVRDHSGYLHTSLAPGDRLVVSGIIPVAPGTRTVYLQDGAIRDPVRLNIWYPSCRLVLAEARDTEISITGSVWEIRGFLLFEQDTSFDTLTTTTIVELESSQAPGVESLVCERAYDMNDYQRVPLFITRDEFEQAVGEYVSQQG